MFVDERASALRVVRDVSVGNLEPDLLGDPELVGFAGRVLVARRVVDPVRVERPPQAVERRPALGVRERPVDLVLEVGRQFERLGASPPDGAELVEQLLEDVYQKG